MKIPFSPPDIGEREIAEVVDTLKSGWITTGPKTKRFEKQLAAYCGTSEVVCLGSQTAAAEMTLRLLGIGAGDEVIVPAYTYTATCSVVLHVGATPVMLDCAPHSCEMDYDKLEQAITRRTKAVIPVDLGGVLCDYERILAIVTQKKELFQPSGKLQEAIGRVVVLADSAHALGASKHSKKSGSFADFTTFSFHAVKNLTTGEGGAVTWKDINSINNKEIYKKYMELSLHGQTKDALSKSEAGHWRYDIAAPYYKCNMTDIAAALGIAQLERYPQMLERRRAIIQRYDAALADEPVHTLQHYGQTWASSGHLYPVYMQGWNCTQRDALIARMAQKGVACNVHYIPLPMLTAYHALGWRIANYPNAYNLYRCEVTLPLYSRLTDQQADYVTDTLRECMKNKKTLRR